MADSRALRHIYIVGAQNTGKTTIVNALQAAFAKDKSVVQPKVIREVARGVLRKHNIKAEDIRTPSSAGGLQKLILEAQFDAENESLEEDKGFFISDRSGIDSIAYARKYATEEKSIQLGQSTEWCQLRDRMKDSLVIVCQAGADWLVDDGVRLMPENREEWIEVDQLFCTCLDEWRLDYEVVPCTLTDIDERVEFVLERWRTGPKDLPSEKSK